MDNAWFDYRFLGQDERVLECIKEYYTTYLRYCGEMGREVDDVCQFFDTKKVQSFKYYKLFYVVVSFCDGRCLRYNEFWDTAFGVAKVFDTDVSSPMFFKNHDFMSNIGEKVKKFDTLRLSELPHFDACNYRGDDIQNAYYVFVCDYIKGKPNSDQIFKRLINAGKINHTFLLDKRYVCE